MIQGVNIVQRCARKGREDVYISKMMVIILCFLIKWLFLLFLIAICARLSESKFPKQLSGQTHLLYGLEHTKLFFVIEK